MTPRANALVVGLGLSLGVGALAAVDVVQRPAEQSLDADASTMGLPAPVRWVPHWLAEPLSRAIADATDPHARK